MSIIMKSKVSGIVVKFDGLRSGTVIANGTRETPLGYYSSTWYEYIKSDRWGPIESKKSKLHKRIKDFL